MSLGETNNNPGNIDYDGTPWLGLTGQNGRFCTFSDPVYGIRAIKHVLKAYVSKHNLFTLKEWVDRWAPPNENNTTSYEQDMTTRTNVPLDKDLRNITPQDLQAIVKGFIIHENGRCIYSDETIAKGCSL